MSWNPYPPRDDRAWRAALANTWNRGTQNRAGRAATIRGREAMQAAASSLAAAARRRTTALSQATRTAVATIPVDARRELRGSLWRLRKVRSPHRAAQALEDELGVLLRVIAPILVSHPLPVHSVGSARVLVAGTASIAAATEQLELLIAAFSAGTTVPATLPIALSAMVAAMAVELYAALSVRVHALEAAGARVDPETVAAEVGWAMAGAGNRPGRAVITRQLVRRLSVRTLARWGRGIVPIAGAAYSGWDAQRTIAAIATLPVPPTMRVVESSRPAGEPGSEPRGESPGESPQGSPGKSIKGLPSGAE